MFVQDESQISFAFLFTIITSNFLKELCFLSILLHVLFALLSLYEVSRSFCVFF